MKTMPTIDDRMVYEFRRTGKRRTSHAMRQGRPVDSRSRVVLQLGPGGCDGRQNGTPCGDFPGMYCCDGRCTFGGCS